MLDAGEPNTATNAQGSFDLVLSSVNLNAPVRIINGFDLATNEVHPTILDISVDETGSYIVTPVSTLVGRLKIADSSLTGTIPQSIVASSLGIDLDNAPDNSILGFDPLAYFTGNDATLASQAKTTFAASQLLMAMGGGNYSINSYITDQTLASLTTAISDAVDKAGGNSSSISLAASNQNRVKQDSFNAVFDGYVDTYLSDQPALNAVQFQSNKATITDYIDGDADNAIQYSMYGSHDGTDTLVADQLNWIMRI